MRLKEIYTICKKGQDDIKKIEILKMDTDYFHVFIPEKFFENLSQVECLKDFLEDFKKTLPQSLRQSTYKKYDSIIKAKERLSAAIECITKMYESTGFDTKESVGLNVKFPMSKNFSEFRKDIDALDFILSKCPFFQSNSETLYLESIDIGSFWMTFAIAGGVVAGSVLLNNIAAFIDKCLIIRSHYLTLQEQKASIEKTKVEQQEKDEALKSLNKIYKLFYENEIRELEEITGLEITDGDEKGRLEQSVEKFNRLIDKGLQIYSTIESPKETKALFEPLEMKYLSISKKIELIEEKQDKK